MWCKLPVSGRPPGVGSRLGSTNPGVLFLLPVPGVRRGERRRGREVEAEGTFWGRGLARVVGLGCTWGAGERRRGGEVEAEGVFWGRGIARVVGLGWTWRGYEATQWATSVTEDVWEEPEGSE